MDVLLVSTCGAGPDLHWSVQAVREMAAGLRERSSTRVRWLLPHPENLQPATLNGVETRRIPCAVPPFSQVSGRLVHVETEVEMTHWLRGDPADRIHVVGHGAPGTAAVAWIGERLGATASIAGTAREMFCHRQDLVHAHGTRCEVVDDYDRCASCVRVAGDWLPGRESRRLRQLRPRDFHNRLDLIVGGIQPVARLRVPTEAERDQALTVGVRPAMCEVGPLNELPEI